MFPKRFQVVPATPVTSVCFGGRDVYDLYIVTANNTDEALNGSVLERGRLCQACLIRSPRFDSRSESV
jgi:sugar lactone lactonase YvrE